MPEHGHDKWEVLPAGEMRRKYSLYADNRPIIKLDPANVPSPLRPLIPLAEVFGIGDDLIRADFIARLPAEALENLRKTVEPFADELDKWLAGPAAGKPPFGPEYIAFTCMRMAADGF